MKRFSVLIVVFSLGGCRGADHSYMPLMPEAEWTYTVARKLATGVESITVAEVDSVGGAHGFRITGPHGTTRMAWKGSKLIASELGGVRFSPAITLLDVNGSPSLPKWSGNVRSMGPAIKAEATGSQRRSQFTLSGRKYPSIEVTLRLRYGERTIESSSVYARGLGLVKLDERQDGDFLSSLEYLSGP